MIAAGGRSDPGIPMSDAIVAFALRRPGDADRGLVEKILDRPGGRFEAGAALSLAALVLLVWGVVR